MVATDPRTNERRKASESAIRVIDIIIYLFFIVAGVFAGFFTPSTVKAALDGYEWLIILWSGLLILGGLAGFVGRLSRRWIIETPGIWPAICGGVVYIVVLGGVALSNTTTLVAVSFLAIATLGLYRRFKELKIFTDDGEPPTTFIEKVHVALRRRTTDAVTRQD